MNESDHNSVKIMIKNPEYSDAIWKHKKDEVLQLLLDFEKGYV